MARKMIGNNPSMSERIFEREARAAAGEADVMTVSGTVNKSILLVGIVAAAAIWVWYHAMPAGGLDRTNPNDMAWVMHRVKPFFGAGIVGFIIALVTCFKPNLARFTSIPYAVCEGLLIGALASFLEMQYPAIAIQAAGLTFGCLVAMLAIYKTGLITVNDKFRRAVFMGVGAIVLIYLATWILGMFGIAMPYIHSGGPIGIGFSLLVIALACASLLVDFDMIERGAEADAPAYMEWYGAFALLVTLVWLYIEMLRLLSKLRER